MQLRITRAAAAALAMAGSAIAFAPVSAAAPAAPCDWVSAQHASDIFAEHVTATPRQAGCWYAAAGEQPGVGISSELLAPGTLQAIAEPVCVTEPMTTPPSTTVVALLEDGRIYRATAAYRSCDTVSLFARNAIDRISKETP